MSLPRYPKYKSSGVDWLGDVPGHWEISLAKNLASIVNGFPFDSALFDSNEGVPLVRIRDLNSSKAETFYRGAFVESAAITSDDVLIGMDGDFNVGRWRGEGRAMLNQRMCCVRGNSAVLTRLLEYILPIRLKAINDVTYATTVKHLASSQVEKMALALPLDSTEQTQIAAFLDRETAKIDALVAEQRHLMELLKEKRQAVISHAVTKGLNPDSPMKRSGIEWLGDVPEHWSVGALGYLASVSSGSTPDRGNPSFWGGDIPWIKTGEIDYLPIFQAEEFITSAGLHGSSAKMSEPGTMLMAMYGQGVTRGRVAILEVAAAYNQACAAIDFGSKVDANFAQYFFIAAYHFIRDTGNETSQMNLSTGIIQKFRLTIPPINEQTEIISFLNKEVATIDVLTTEAQRAIDLLQERRTALISAAVTGQIDVRGASSQQS
jgi:type I restriction enzyme S subunit